MSTIRAFTSYNESSNTRGYRMFDIIDSLPEVGGTYNGEEVKEVNSVYLDAEQDSDEVYNYDYYHVITKCLDAEDLEDKSDYFVAVESINKENLKKYYIVEFGEVVSTANFLGNYKEIWDAKEDAFSEMGDGDLLVGFDGDIDAEITDEYGYKTVNLSLAKDDEKVRLLKTDSSMDVPAGLYFWEDDTEDTYYYNADGSRWEEDEE